MAYVHLTRTDTYEDAVMDAVIAEQMQTLHIADDLTPETRVLLKPNLLAARSPEHACTTHPALIAAVARWLRAQGVKQIVLADSPGGMWSDAILDKLYNACGITPLAELVTLNRDMTDGTRGSFHLMKPVLECDYLIDLCKLKTHGLTVMTGGVKNLFGCIPGLQKPEWHARKPSAKAFCRAMVELCETVKPNLTLMDAVDCMEGNGPGGGTVRHMGYVLGSRSPYALDEAAAQLMGHAPERMPMICAARDTGFPADGVQCGGAALIPADPPFTLPDSVTGRERFFSPNGLFHAFYGKLHSYPVVRRERCVGCGRCAESCPKHLIRIEDGRAVMKRAGCISCFCCQEMCPAKAIGVKKCLL